MTRPFSYLTGFACLALLLTPPALAQRGNGSGGLLLDDFEQYEEGQLPFRWKAQYNKELVPLEQRFMRPNERFFVVEDGGNTLLRVYTHNETVHITMANEADGFDWNLETHPRLSWDWRAHTLPTEARETDRRKNDTGVAVYVIFSFDWLRRPRVVKYTYSSTLPVGTVADYGQLKALVVSSGADGNLGEWQHIERNVYEDYRRLFRKDPPSRPLMVRLWSDSDDTNAEAEADFDNIRFLPAQD